MDKQTPTPLPATTTVVSLDMNNDPFVFSADQVQYIVVPTGSDQVSVAPSRPDSPVPSTSALSVEEDWDTDFVAHEYQDVSVMRNTMDVIRKCWTVIVRHVPLANVLPKPVIMAESVPVLGMPRFSDKEETRPVSLLAKSTGVMVNNFLADATKPFSRGLIPISMIASDLKAFTPTTPYMNLSSSTESGVTELPKTRSLTFNISNETLTSLELRAAHCSNISNFFCLCGDAIRVIQEIEPALYSEDDAADLKVLATALSIVARDNAILQTVREADLRLIRRDAYLKQSTLPDDVKRRCRRSSLVPETVFGPETQQVVDTATGSVRAILTEFRPASARRSNYRGPGRQSYRSSRPTRPDPPAPYYPQGRMRRGRGRRGRPSATVGAPAPKSS
jgi:hypothetical protein